MTWHSSDMLWLLLVVPVVIAAGLVGWKLRTNAAARFGKAARSMIVGRSTALRATRGVLLVLGLTLTIVALARPQYGSRTRMLRKRGVDVVFVMDFSKSMLAQDVRPSRIERAKAEVTKFIGELGGDRVGIVAFAGETMEFPMTVDYAAAALFFRELGPLDMPVGGTAIGRALTAATRLLQRSIPKHKAQAAAERSQVVVLMTDGEDHEGDPVEAARELAQTGARLHVVGIGSRTGEPIPTYALDGTWTGYMRDEDGKPIVTALTADNEKQLRRIAQAGGGRYLRAKHGSVGMAKIRQAMTRMKQRELKARRITVHEERYALVLLPAFLLIVLEALLPEAWIGRRRQQGQP
ncbi:MAG: VWA domain-containing protein [Proteobacteria bacterium]|nr:VWA domain-containing protein [Pseudomonadota bacterium]